MIEMTIAELELGKGAIIRAIEGDPLMNNQLQELGFTPGCEVKLVSRGPFRDPLAFTIRGTTIALRKAEAAVIKI